jgi:hypothetical protein
MRAVIDIGQKTIKFGSSIKTYPLVIMVADRPKIIETYSRRMFRVKPGEQILTATEVETEIEDGKVVLVSGPCPVPGLITAHSLCTVTAGRVFAEITNATDSVVTVKNRTPLAVIEVVPQEVLKKYDSAEETNSPAEVRDKCSRVLPRSNGKDKTSLTKKRIEQIRRRVIEVYKRVTKVRWSELQLATAQKLKMNLAEVLKCLAEAETNNRAMASLQEAQKLITEAF